VVPVAIHLLLRREEEAEEEAMAVVLMHQARQLQREEMEVMGMVAPEVVPVAESAREHPELREPVAAEEEVLETAETQPALPVVMAQLLPSGPRRPALRQGLAAAEPVAAAKAQLLTFKPAEPVALPGFMARAARAAEVLRIRARAAQDKRARKDSLSSHILRPQSRLPMELKMRRLRSGRAAPPPPTIFLP
jgi:hypothetical protein